MRKTSTGFHVDEIYLRHRNPEGHPERVERIEVLLDLSKRVEQIGVTGVPARRRATIEELSLAHTPEYVEAIASTAGRTLMLDPDTFTVPDSFDVACHAAGATLDLVDRVVAREFDNAFTAVRPPGHHAESERAMGFCLFNNIAVAAAHAVHHHKMERVLIVDWDVHHGNGTQDAFYDDPSVFFFSSHQSPWYPGTGRREETGHGKGLGTTMNRPLPEGTGMKEIRAIFSDQLLPALDAFKPELVLISAGFDSRVGDPLGRFTLEDPDFGELTSLVRTIADRHAEGRILSLLEGGYNVRGLASAASAHFAALG